MEKLITVMLSQVLALSPTSGNKKKKKEAIERKPKGQKKAQLIEKYRYNAAFELAIEKEKKNKIH